MSASPVLVVGGGVEGVRAALKQAESGRQVYLVEEGPVLGAGGTSAALLSRLRALGDRVRVITMADLAGVEWVEDGFRVKVRRRAPRVVEGLCNSCEACVRVCLANMDDAERGRMSLRTAIDSLTPGHGGYHILRETPPCQEACPIHLDVRGYVGLVADGRYHDSLAVIEGLLPFPGTIGRICTRPCEAACNRGLADEPVAICALKRFVADRAMEEVGDVVVRNGGVARPVVSSGRKVAVIGSGPTGLTCAYELVRVGHGVTVFEALPVAGGMLRVGIPEYRLPHSIVEGEIAALERAGVRVQTNMRLGRDVTLDGLFKDGYDAVFLALGAHLSQRLGIPGEGSRGVVHGVEFLRELNLGHRPWVGRRVVVVGGGNVAIDSARSALRLGAEKVSIVYRRTGAEMPAYESERNAAIAEGVDIMYLSAPKEVLVSGGGVCGLRCVLTELGAPDASGRRAPLPVPDSDFDIEADMVIPAIGQAADLGFLSGDGEVKASAGRLEADPDTLATSLEGVFAGGDVVTGPRTAIEAIAAGKRAAVSIDRYLRQGRCAQGR
ncbi:MAG: FAD-dependent oxidoreductase [Chloroflexota bacterium]